MTEPNKFGWIEQPGGKPHPDNYLRPGKDTPEYFGYVAPDAPTPPPPSETRDWPEDAAHENGHYTNTCTFCKSQFIGHKRRVICKLCAQIQPPPSETAMAQDPPEDHDDFVVLRNLSAGVYREFAEAHGIPIQPPSETKLKEAIDALCKSIGNFDHIAEAWQHEEAGTWQMEDAQKSVNSARSSLESLFREQTEELDAIAEQHRMAIDELSALRSLQLTQKEALELIDWLPVDGIYIGSHALIEAARDKILRISSKATSEEQ